MVNVLENEYRPDYVSPPGETLQEVLEDLGMSQADLARRTGRPEKTINEIVKGKTAITPETSIQLERVLRIPAEFWLRREQHYRESIARQQEEENLAAQVEWLKQIPVREMIAKGWIEASSNDVQQLREVLSFFGITSPEQWSAAQSNVSFRQSHAYQVDPFAVEVWLRRGEIEALDLDCAPYDARRFRVALRRVRALTTKPAEEFVPELQAICSEVGVAVVFVPELRGTRVSGVTRWLTSHKALIQLSLRYRTDDHLWFTFFHEAGHILLHGKRDIFLEAHYTEERGQQIDEQMQQKERAADQFAANTLISPRQMQELESLIPPPGMYIGIEAIKSFADGIGIAPGIVVGRLQHEGHLPYTHCNRLKRRFEWSDE